MNKVMMDEREFGQQIRHRLNASIGQLDKPVAERLHAARQTALARQCGASSQLSLASVGRSGLTWCDENLRPFLLALGLATAVVCGNYLMSAQRLDDLEDIDSALLSDDLPIDAYLDSGFHSWLADNSSQR